MVYKVYFIINHDKTVLLKPILDDWEPVNTESSRSVIFSISARRIKGGGLKIVAY